MNQTQEESSNFFKQKRDEYLIDIRKKKNTDQIEAKRAKLTLGNQQPQVIPDHSSPDYSHIPLNELATSFVNLLKSQNLADLPNIARAIRLAVSKDDALPIEELINTGVVPYMISVLTPQFFSETDLLAECSWIIVNIASDDHYVKSMVEQEIIPIAMQLLEHPAQDIKENAIWILANVASDSFEYRISVLNQGIARKIDQLFNDRSLRPSLHNHLIWLISNLCMGKPYPDFGLLGTFLLYIQGSIKNSKKERVIGHCLHALSYLTDTDDENQVDEIINMDILDDLILFLKSGVSRYKAPILRIVSNIAANSDEHVDHLIERGFIEALFPLLEDEKKLIRRETCFAYSNILAGRTLQINKVFAFEHGKIIEKLFQMATHDLEEIAEECIFALCSASEAGSTEIRFLVDLDYIQMIVELLTKTNREDIVKQCLKAIKHVLDEGLDIVVDLEISAQENPYLIKLLECNGLNVIEKLIDFPNAEVFELVDYILKQFGDKV